MKTLKKFKLNFGLNISIKLNKMLMCGIFSSSWAVSSVFLRNYFWPVVVKREKGDKACNLVVASRDILQFKLELMPNY